MNADTILKLAREAAAQNAVARAVPHRAESYRAGRFDQWYEVQSARAMAPLVIAAIADELGTKAKQHQSVHLAVEAARLRASIEQPS